MKLLGFEHETEKILKCMSDPSADTISSASSSFKIYNPPNIIYPTFFEELSVSPMPIKFVEQYHWILNEQ